MTLRRLTAAAAVGVLTGIVACGGGGESAPFGPPTLLAAVDLGERASEVAVGEGAVWVAGGGVLWRFDPEANQVTATIDVAAGTVATGEGAVWVVGDGVLSRIDPVRGQVTGTVPLGSPRGVAAGHGSVWVADHADGGVLHRIDARSLEIEVTVKVPGLPGDDLDLPEEPSHVAVGEGGVWVADATRGHASRLDVGRDEFTLTRSRLGLQTGDIAAGKGWVWLVNEFGLGRIRPGDDAADSIEVSVAPLAVAVGRWAVWVVGSGEGGISVVDPETGTETLLGAAEEPPVDVAVGFESVWVLGRDGLLSRYTETGPTTSSSSPAG